MNPPDSDINKLTRRDFFAHADVSRIAVEASLHFGNKGYPPGNSKRDFGFTKRDPLFL